MAKDAVVVVCTCSGDCPGMAGMNFIELSERLRLETRVQVLAFHPHLCDESGINLLHDIVKPDRYHIVAACSDEVQGNGLREGFTAGVVPMDEAHYKPLNMIGKSVSQIIDEIRIALQQAGFDQPVMHNA